MAFGLACCGAPDRVLFYTLPNNRRGRDSVQFKPSDVMIPSKTLAEHSHGITRLPFAHRHTFKLRRSPTLHRTVYYTALFPSPRLSFPHTHTMNSLVYAFSDVMKGNVSRVCVCVCFRDGPGLFFLQRGREL